LSMEFFIDPDIRKAETLPASFYRDLEVFEALKEKVFLRSWQWVGDEDQVSNSTNVFPFILLPDYLNEPLLLTRDNKNKIHCMSNVCTHRGNRVVEESGNLTTLTCRYHGRKFDINGGFRHMPEFKEALDFPGACDDLPQFPLNHWGPLVFAGFNPHFSMEKILSEIDQRVGFLPWDKFEAGTAKDYEIKAHWALYCDNYLEGLHIPFVHQGLNSILDFGSYSTEIFDYYNLQIGYTDDPADAFDLPEDHPDHGKLVAAWYYWIFPNMMFNFYPWGLSINIVCPLGMDRTHVTFIPYVFDASKLKTGAGAELDQVEMEDEEVVENVQTGINSRFYKAGRFSPKREQGVHHFHRLLAEFLNREA
jgi:phenylpropionate dioxygenase-like ring-hydroxylating dioxygenase large terminal subunit